MLRINSNLQTTLLDPFEFLGPKRKAMLEGSWAYLFREMLYGELPVDAIKHAFHSDLGRPSKELHTMLGVLLLQQMFDLTDEETQRHLSFNIEWHYALNLQNEEDADKYLCERTLRTYRSMVTGLEVDRLMFQSLTDTLLDALNIPTEKQRLDSTHIRSNMRRLSRLELLRKTVTKFLKVMRREHPRLLKKHVDAELVDRYLKEKNGYFSRVKPSEAQEGLQQAAEDMLTLVETFRDHPKIKRLSELALLQRVLAEQCNVTGEAEEAKVELKAPKDVSSGSVQNPSDVDAAYSGHKGEGYTTQLMETYQEKEPEDEAGSKQDSQEQEKPKPNIISYVDVKPANAGDSGALMPAVQETKERDCAPEQLLADSLYGSDENVQKAAKEDVEVTAPTMGKPKRKEEMLILDDFTVDEETGEVTSCPGGETPCDIQRKENGGLKIHFDPAGCEGCDHQDYCEVGLNGEHALEYTPKQLRLAQRRVAEESDEFREKYRWRSGIEAVNAKLKRMMGMGRLRVRGLGPVRFAVMLKVLGWNIFQAARA